MGNWLVCSVSVRILGNGFGSSTIGDTGRLSWLLFAPLMEIGESGGETSVISRHTGLSGLRSALCEPDGNCWVQV